MNISQIIAAGAGKVSLAVAPIDLREFAREVYKQGRIDAAEEARKKAEKQKQADRLLTLDEVASQLRVTRSCLYRWNKRGYLVPTTYAGNHPRYSSLVIDKLLADRKKLGV